MQLIEHYKKIMVKLEELNDRMVVVNWEHFRKAGTVVAIAGGQYKLRVLWTLLIVGFLDESKRFVKELCTDVENAKELRRALAQYQAAPAHVREFYESAALLLFNAVS